MPATWPAQGSIRIDDGSGAVEVSTAAPRELMRLRRDVIGYVSQFLRTVPRVAAIDVVAEPLIEEAGDSLDQARDALQQAEGLLRRLRIPARLWQVPPATFSGGEQQRVNIARGFIRRAKRCCCWMNQPRRWTRTTGSR